MNPETKYKLSALAFFFVLFIAFFLQFVHPYSLVVIPQEHLADNVFIFPLAVLAALIYLFQFWLYFPLRHKIKIIPLISAGLVLILLFCVNQLNQAKNLDTPTTQKIIELLR